jgi:hypothetical protein
MRGFRATQNLLAVSANTAETALNTFQNADTTLLVAEDNLINLTPRRETNADEANGREEPDIIYDDGATSELSISFSKAQPQHYALLLAYGLGKISSAALGNGYQHTITPISGELNYDQSQPGFTAVQRLGNTIAKRRFASMFVNEVTASFNKDEWASLSASIVGTGKFESSLTTEMVSALDNATTITLAANAVQGATAAERLDSIHQVSVELTAGVRTEVEVTAVSDATPAVLTITNPGGSGDTVNYHILYSPTEPAWCSFPARVNETPLKVCALEINMGGAWNGSAFVGGRTLTSELSSVEYTLSNGLEVSFVPGGCNNHANRVFRPMREQKITVSRELRDWIMQQYMADNHYFGMKMSLQGAEFATGENYLVEFIFPRLAVLTSPLGVDSKRLTESGDIQVLEDETYGSVIVQVVNQVAAYAG